MIQRSTAPRGDLRLNVWEKLKRQSEGKGKRSLIEQYLTLMKSLNIPSAPSTSEMKS